ncbi:MAG: glycosyltransferase [Polaribacter sp.]
MQSVEALIYIDTDTLLLDDIAKLWKTFSLFNQYQFVAMTSEDESAYKSYYYKKRLIPFYGKYGLAAGVLLMNLTRMRQFEFSRKIISIYEKYKNRLKYGDQCILNIFFHFHPDIIYIYIYYLYF